ncbi:uncharacterized protein YbbC (DUF1343 family) [Mangrovibacterium marinum]|uniref:Uncharacterized protein YbbC (DUF1343 family) n=2 Tax=Mangrovibacterium marinum TaxID=1639118 RepID=A0A2T5C1J0_9BACT|nr:uncharacterized protein YbbC (DUF1343 family) [Mangrovibacterium marinum]
MRILLVILFCASLAGCAQAQQLKCGADQPEQYLGLLEGKHVGLVVNPSSRVGDEHLVDFLLRNGIAVEKIFSPEHGFRGDADAGEQVRDQKDQKTSLPVISLYGDNKKPRADQLDDLDLLVFDIQDVGVRFYTYLSTLHYVMEACAEENRKLLLLDRPNPNGDYVAGPVLKPQFSSFVGMHPIPVVHGCTLGELARMINGEGWLKGGLKCDLTVVAVANYSHRMPYSLPVKPSPNLPNDRSIRLYPSLCFFEATTMSIGRGTYFPFQVIGYPDPSFGTFQFTPRSIVGMAKSPKQEGQLCYGDDLRTAGNEDRFTLRYFLHYYHAFENESDFLSSPRWFNLLAGTDELLKMIREGAQESDIEASWKPELDKYGKMRQKYLLYED